MTSHILEALQELNSNIKILQATMDKVEANTKLTAEKP